MLSPTSECFNQLHVHLLDASQAGTMMKELKMMGSLQVGPTHHFSNQAICNNSKHFTLILFIIFIYLFQFLFTSYHLNIQIITKVTAYFL